MAALEGQIMDIKKAIWDRRSIRKFKKEKIPTSVLYNILDAGVQAPSSCNQQLFYFVLVDDPALKQKLEKEAGFKWIDRIPHPVFVVTDKRFGNEKFSNIQGASAAIENMLLYAYSLGIGSCWIAGYGDKAIVKRLLHIPSYFHILGCVGLGYPDERPIPPIKRSAREITFVNHIPFPEEATNNPEDWTYKDIQSLAARTIFAKSPDIGYYHLFPLELEQQLHFISSKLGKEVLYLEDISGIYLFKLAQMHQRISFTMVSSSKKVVAWMEEKAQHHKIKNISFVYSPDLTLPKKQFDTVLCLDQVNRLPSRQREQIIALAHRSLKKDSTLLLSFLNKRSLYGALFRKGVGRRYGPEISLTYGSLATLLNKQFTITERVGFNLLPSPKLFFKMGVPGRYTVFNPFMRYLARFNLLEGSTNSGFLARFSTTNILVAKK